MLYTYRPSGALEGGQVGGTSVTGDARPTERGYCWVSRFPVQPNLRASIGVFIVDFRINETLQIGAVGNSAYRVGLNAVRLQTAPTGWRKYLFIF